MEQRVGVFGFRFAAEEGSEAESEPDCTDGDGAERLEVREVHVSSYN